MEEEKLILDNEQFVNDDDDDVININEMGIKTNPFRKETPQQPAIDEIKEPPIMNDRTSKKLMDIFKKDAKNKSSLETIPESDSLSSFSEPRLRKDKPSKKDLLREESKTLRSAKILTVKGYLQSARFGEFLCNHVGVSPTMVKSLSDDRLDDVHREIKCLLNKRYKERFVENLTRNGLVLIETTVTPFYDIRNFSTVLSHNEEFLDCLEELKLEIKGPALPLHIRIAMIIGQTALLCNQMNSLHGGGPQMDPEQIHNFEQEEKKEEKPNIFQKNSMLQSYVVKKALVQGALLYGYGSYRYPGGFLQLPSTGTVVSTATALSIAGVGSGLIGDNIQQIIQPTSAKRGEKYARGNTALASALMNGATYLGFMAVLNPGVLGGSATQLAWLAGEVVSFLVEEKSKMSIFKEKTWKKVGQTLSKPFSSNGGSPPNVADTIAKIGWGGDSKDIGNAAKDVFGAGKGVVNEVWGTAKGVLNTGENLLGNVVRVGHLTGDITAKKRCLEYLFNLRVYFGKRGEYQAKVNEFNFKMLDDEATLEGKYFFQKCVDNYILGKEEWEIYKMFFNYCAFMLKDLLKKGLSHDKCCYCFERLIFAAFTYLSDFLKRKMSIVTHPKNDIPYENISDIRGDGHIPAVQVVAQVQKENYITVYMNPPPATTCMSSGTLTWFDLQPRIAQNVKTLDLRINITCSNAKVTVLPAPYWFRTLRVRINKGSGDYIQWIYPENIVLHYSLMDPIRRKWYEDHGMIKFYEEKEHYRFVYPNPLEVGETRDVYIPIPTSFWDMGAIHFQHMSQDIRLEFEFDSDFVISGTATNITVNNIAIVINQFDLTGDEQEEWLTDLRSTAHYYNYLDCIRVTDNSKTMTQSAKTNFDLQNFIAKSPFLLVVIKPSTAPTASDHSKYRPLDWGDGATVEIENPSNEPLLGKGNSPKWEYLEKRFVELTGKKQIRGFYIINFCQSLYDAYNGIIRGFYPFAGVKDTLAITFGGAGIQETSTLTPDAAPTAGRFHVMFDGRELGTVAYNANAAALAAAINGSDPFTRTGQTVSSNAAVSAGTAITLTWSVPDGSVSKNFNDKVICLLGDALADHYFAATNGKNGKTGWTTSNYNSKP
ncbi:hypothetical protein RFI_17703 [Reticulomyxa filosa]|uniref:Uncharacterized protein n=1 Tax=Reticulomyxa filosa TaxID=46433 RepID=X6N0E2_RETFI|nr:hypothetical protein RFI_17703 [Reticulomyxa filosa]|eukprot:ETO19526.1 hypothetical protein RFI_17703 [Reticulomyxa filosa]